MSSFHKAGQKAPAGVRRFTSLLVWDYSSCMLSGFFSPRITPKPLSSKASAPSSSSLVPGAGRAHCLFCQCEAGIAHPVSSQLKNGSVACISMEMIVQKITACGWTPNQHKIHIIRSSYAVWGLNAGWV